MSFCTLTGPRGNRAMTQLPHFTLQGNPDTVGMACAGNDDRIEQLLDSARNWDHTTAWVFYRAGEQMLRVGGATHGYRGLRVLRMTSSKPFAWLRTCTAGPPAGAKVSWVGCSHPSTMRRNRHLLNLPCAWASSCRPIPWPVRRSLSVCCMKLPTWPVRPVTAQSSWWGLTGCWPA